MKFAWLAAAVAVAPLTAGAQVRPPKGWEAQGERIVHTASGLACPQKLANFKLSGAGIDKDVPACGYTLACERQDRKCAERIALLSLSAIADPAKPTSDFRTMMQKRRMTDAAVSQLGADSALGANVKENRKELVMALWFKARSGRHLMAGGLYAPDVAGEVEAFVAAALAQPT